MCFAWTKAAERMASVLPPLDGEWATFSRGSWATVYVKTDEKYISQIELLAGCEVRRAIEVPQHLADSTKLCVTAGKKLGGLPDDSKANLEG